MKPLRRFFLVLFGGFDDASVAAIKYAARWGDESGLTWLDRRELQNFARSRA